MAGVNCYPSLKLENVQLSKPDLAQVIKEGESLEIAESDFTEVRKIPALEVDFDSVKAVLEKRHLEKHILFEI